MRILSAFTLFALLAASAPGAAAMDDKLQQAIDCSAAEAVLGAVAKAAAADDPDRAKLARQFNSSGRRWLFRAVDLAPDDNQSVLDAYKARAKEFGDGVVAGSNGPEMRSLIDSCSAAEKEIFGTSYSELE